MLTEAFLAELLTVEQCADKAQVSPRTIKREILSGKLRATRVRGSVRIAPEDWGRYLEQCRSADTGQDGKSGFNTLGAELAGLLQLAPTRSTLKRGSGSGSTILALAEHPLTRSRKR